MSPSMKKYVPATHLLFALFALLALLPQARAVEPSAAAVPEAAGRPVLETTSALRGPIDEELYVVGPSDRLTVTVWGTAVRTFTASVTPEGELLLPGMTGVGVAGLKLGAAKELLMDRLRGVYHDVEISIVLSGLRRLQVNVLGGVKDPGVYEAAVMTPASEFIERAGGLEKGASRRNIRITRLDGSVARLDLDTYENAGDVTADPPVLDGGIIFVPVAEAFVYAQGAVSRPGEYEYVENEDLGSLIEAAGGLTHDAFPDTVELRRFVDASTTERAMIPFGEERGAGSRRSG